MFRCAAAVMAALDAQRRRDLFRLGIESDDATVTAPDEPSPDDALPR